LNNKYVRIIIVIITIFILLPGCSGKSKDNKASKPNMEAAQKPPQELKTLLTDIESMITDLAGLIAMENKYVSQIKIADSQASKNTESDQSKNEQTDSQAKSGQQNKSSDQKKTADTSDQQQKKWQTLTSKLKDIHKNWNKIESEAIKAGLTVTERNKFETIMENLTLDISQQKQMSGLQDAIELYGQYASLAKVFKSDIPAEYYKTKYEIMAAGVEALGGDWDQAVNRLPRLKDNWNSFKVKAKVKNEKLLNCSDLSIDDFAAAVSGKKIDILIIKAEIALANLGQIEKSLSQSKKAQ